MTSRSNRLLSPREVALEIFGRATRPKVQRVRELIQRGDIEAKKLGGMYYVPKTEIDRLLSAEKN